MIRCPQCDHEMNQVKVHANPGQLIMLDQCGKCGGIWCDKWELFPVDPEEAERIDPLDESLLKDRTALTQRQLYCPRCTAELQVFAEPILPKEIQLQRCGRCDGIWLNRGQFRRYKEFQKRTRVEKLGTELGTEAFVKLEHLGHRQVHVVVRQAPEHVRNGVALAPEGCRNQDCSG